LRNANRGFAVGGGEGGGEVVVHFAGGAEGFAGVGQQGLGVVGGVGEVHAVGFVDRGHDAGAGAEVVVEGAFGGFAHSIESRPQTLLSIALYDGSEKRAVDADGSAVRDQCADVIPNFRAFNPLSSF